MSLEHLSYVERDEERIKGLSDAELEKGIKQVGDILKKGPDIMQKEGQIGEEAKAKMGPWGYVYELYLSEKERRENPKESSPER